MSFLKGIFGKRKAKAVLPREVTCLHVTLAPKWDNATDIGIEDKATSFICDACHTSFTPEAARALHESLAERVRADEAKT